MFVDATLGGSGWSITFRADSCWLWNTYYTHLFNDEQMIALDFGFIGFEIRRRLPKPKLTKKKKKV